MKKILILVALSISSYANCNDSPEHSDAMIVNDYSQVWSCITEGKFEEAKDILDDLNFVCEEEYLHQMMIKLHIAFRENNKADAKRIMKNIIDFSSDVYCPY